MTAATDKNEPGRFLGEGVSFRAKLIGVLEVPEARGDRMCQEALADLKMAIRAAGEHKQRIQVHVAIDGLRLRDDKTGDSLYHHPVHKISFIAQDMTDSRAFGYIFGSPDTGHRFFGIKTDKAASQVVIAMRDLFQVVFELKKKEIELAKQQLEGKSTTSSLVQRAITVLSDPRAKVPKIIPSSAGETSSTSSKAAEAAEGGVAELVDLEQELSSLRRGLTQVEGLTPSGDPFGDSFISPPQKGLLPPPPPGSSRGRPSPAAPAPPSAPARALFSPTKAALPFDLATVAAEFEPVVTATAAEPDNTVPAAGCDVFTDLDPLGTGRSKPYVDKKLFFQELKNPPKKVLKDLVPTIPDIEKPDQYGSATTMTSLSRQSGGSVSIAKPVTTSSNYFALDPFAETDPFDTDPFSDSFKDDPFSNLAEFPKQLSMEESKRKLEEARKRVEEVKSKLGEYPAEGTRGAGGEQGVERGERGVERGERGAERGERVVERGVERGERGERGVFNGPLQVSLPPEPAPKSPRLQRQTTDSSSVRQRPQPSSKLHSDSASPPPPLPPKKVGETVNKPPPRPPHEADSDGPPLPPPSRKKEPLADRSTKPRLSSAATNSSSDEYLSPAPPPLPAARRFDITLTQLLTLDMPELSNRLRVPAATLSSMTLPQLTGYLRSYLAADTDRAHIHIEPSTQKTEKPTQPKLSSMPTNPMVQTKPIQIKSEFEDNFAPSTETNGSFVANFEDFDKKINPSYDRYAAFREIQELELKSIFKSDPLEDTHQNGDDNKQDSDEKEELSMDLNMDQEVKEVNRSPLKSLDELTLDSFNMFRKSVSPKPSQIDSKIEDIKNVMKTLQIEQARRSVSPRESMQEQKKEDDRYAALREITITEPQDEFESLPPEPPKERKRSDEKSDGFDNSDFFDCIDNSSLSFTHVEEAFRKSPIAPILKETVKEEVEKIELSPMKEVVRQPSPRQLQPPPRLSAGSMSDVASASSPDAKEPPPAPAPAEGGGRWSVLAARASPWSSDSRDSDRAAWRRDPPRRRRHARDRQTSSSSRDVSPWEEEPPSRHHRAPTHHRESRHNSSGSRECLDSGSGRDKDKIPIKRERERDREHSSGRERDRRDSGSGRDRRGSKDRERRDRKRDDWDRERDYSRDRDYRERERDPRDSRSRERGKELRDRHRPPRSWDDDDDYSDGCGSGRSSPRARWSEHRWRRDERNYGSLGWRETRRRAELRQEEEPGDRTDRSDRTDRRYGATLAWANRRSTTTSARRDDRRRPRRDEPRHRPRDQHQSRDSPREPHQSRNTTRETHQSRDGSQHSNQSREAPRDVIRDRFSNDFSPREREREHSSPFENDFVETPTPVTKKRGPYTSLEGTRFAFEPEEAGGSPASGSSLRARDGDSPAARFRFDSDSVSPRSLFEDDFTALSTPRARAASIAEEDESDLPPLRPKPPPTHKDIKKSDSVNIFVRETDPFEGDDFFACTGSDRAARRENWPGDFQAFDNV